MLAGVTFRNLRREVWPRPLAALPRCFASASRFGTPVKDSRSINMDLYDEVFRPLGVSVMQFEKLMSFAQKCKASPGSLVVKGGQVHGKFVLLTYGVAVAHKPTPTPEERGPAICTYTGRLTKRSEMSEEVQALEVPVRGSVVGGSALVDASVTQKPYPADIIAAADTEYLEWELDDLQRIIDAPGWRAVQACFFHLLYVELLGTLDRDRAAKIRADMAPDTGASEHPKKPPSTKQLLQLLFFIAVPFFGFGFADNAIMIVCGDFIDAQFGVMFGLTTMASAGLGNWVSDTIGLGLGDVIERSAQRVGLSNGGLSPAQERMQIAKLTTLGGKLIGISLGCFAGMLPLLFLKPVKVEIAKEDLEVYESTFLPSGVSTAAFVGLIQRGRRRRKDAGAVLVKGGAPFPKVMLLLHGEAAALRLVSDQNAEGDTLPAQQAGEPSHKYLGRLEDIVARTAVEWIEWEYQDLMAAMKAEATIQASIVSVLFHEMVNYVSLDNPTQRSRLYKILMMAVLADGKVDDSERKLLSKYREDHRISEQEHLSVLQELGWSEEGFGRGWMNPENCTQATAEGNLSRGYVRQEGRSDGVFIVPLIDQRRRQIQLRFPKPPRKLEDGQRLGERMKAFRGETGTRSQQPENEIDSEDLQVEMPDFQELIRRRKVKRDGDEVCAAMPLTLDPRLLGLRSVHVVSNVTPMV
ncbi:unnamed protein product [Effrenium voratum]|nr:unnamed protein product [Effrenium voratum]